MFRKFAASTSGNFAVTTALASSAFLFAVGFGIDITSMMSAKNELQSALDASLMAASRLGSADASRRETFDAFFAANVQDKHILRDPVAEIVIDESITSISNTAVAYSHVNLNFMSFFNVDPRISVRASTYESKNDIEVALVLDNTGSMGESRMKALRSAAVDLVDILEASQGGDKARTVKAALVPFVTAVNVRGTGFKEDWIDSTAASPLHGVNFDKVDGVAVNHFTLFERLGKEWKGCVEARPEPHNLADTPPDPYKPETLFVPYFAPDEPGDASSAGNNANAFNNSYLDDTVTGTERERQQSIVKYSATTTSTIAETPPLTNGPNRACATPIEPLTEDFDTLRTAIKAMTFWNGSGTNVSEGLAWGRRVLSPEEPFTEGAPFGSELVAKSVVVFTDGTNEVYGATNAVINKSDYGAYSFLDQGRMTTTVKSQAVTKVNEWTQSMCTQLKAQDVEIFTVLLGADTAANRTLYSRCASKPENYFATSDVAELRPIFQKIGGAIARLHFTN
jgi:Flp pilus assembly protein TadG